MKMLQIYGGKCACCLESNPFMLTFDHVANDGNRHRREIGTAHLGEWLYKQSGHPLDGIQVLCFNCNLGKGKNGGICPHESLRTFTEVRADSL
jgi:hypothetical protein